MTPTPIRKGLRCSSSRNDSYLTLARSWRNATNFSCQSDNNDNKTLLFPFFGRAHAVGNRAYFVLGGI